MFHVHLLILIELRKHPYIVHYGYEVDGVMPTGDGILTDIGTAPNANFRLCSSMLHDDSKTPGGGGGGGALWYFGGAHTPVIKLKKTHL